MKYLSVQELADELELENGVINDLLSAVIEEESKTHQDKHFILDQETQEAFVLMKTDIDHIKESVEKITFLQLRDHFNLSSERMNWMLEYLQEKKILDNSTVEYYTKVKDKPEFIVRYEPEEIKLGDEIFLVVVVRSDVDIHEPEIEVKTPYDIELVYSPTLPDILTSGEWVYRYQLRSYRYGSFKVEALFKGIIKEQAYRETIEIDELRIMSLPPDIYAERIPQAPEVYGKYNQDIDIMFRITNRGKGEAYNTKITGLEDSNVRVISGENIGIVNVKTRNDHTIIVRPVRSGDILLDSMTIVYEDGDGNEYSFSLEPVTLKIQTPEPDLKIEFDSRPIVSANEPFTISLRLTNVGNGSALNLRLRTKVEPANAALNVPSQSIVRQLAIGRSRNWNYEIRAPSEGEIKIEVTDIIFENEEGSKFTEETPPLVISVQKEYVDKGERLDWPFQIGVKIDKYVIKSELGKGGFATVYLVEDTVMKEDRALKALKADYINDPIMVDEFISEVRNTQKMYSPYIIRVFDIQKYEYKNQSYPYIIMEAILGGSLRDRMMPGEPMGVIDACWVIRDICDALLMAHQSDLIHQDIKPSNIMFDEDLVMWKLGDFGLAKIMKGREVFSEDGSIGYMAPEKVKTAKSDIYSMGIVMREMLTGTRRGDLQQIKQSSNLGTERVEKIISLVEGLTDNDPDKRPELPDILKVMHLNTVRDRR